MEKPQGAAKQLAAAMILNPIRLSLIEIQRRLEFCPRCADTSANSPRNPRFVPPHDKTHHFHAELFTGVIRRCIYRISSAPSPLSNRVAKSNFIFGFPISLDGNTRSTSLVRTNARIILEKRGNEIVMIVN